MKKFDKFIGNLLAYTIIAALLTSAFGVVVWAVKWIGGML